MLKKLHSISIKELAIFFVLMGFILPFIFLRDFYPFYRFGMFAEPVKQAVQKELFIIQFTDSKYQNKIFEAENYGWNKDTFTYLKRNYFYREESQKLLQIIKDKLKERNTKNWQLLHLQPNQSGNLDTLNIINLVE